MRPGPFRRGSRRLTCRPEPAACAQMGRCRFSSVEPFGSGSFTQGGNVDRASAFRTDLAAPPLGAGRASLARGRGGPLPGWLSVCVHVSSFTQPASLGSGPASHAAYVPKCSQSLHTRESARAGSCRSPVSSTFASPITLSVPFLTTRGVCGHVSEHTRC